MLNQRQSDGIVINPKEYKINKLRVPTNVEQSLVLVGYRGNFFCFPLQRGWDLILDILEECFCTYLLPPALLLSLPPSLSLSLSHHRLTPPRPAPLTSFHSRKEVRPIWLIKNHTSTVRFMLKTSSIYLLNIKNIKGDMKLYNFDKLFCLREINSQIELIKCERRFEYNCLNGIF